MQTTFAFEGAPMRDRQKGSGRLSRAGYTRAIPHLRARHSATGNGLGPPIASKPSPCGFPSESCARDSRMVTKSESRASRAQAIHTRAIPPPGLRHGATAKDIFWCGVRVSRTRVIPSPPRRSRLGATVRGARGMTRGIDRSPIPQNLILRLGATI